MSDLTGARWRKSSRSGSNGACVEVARNLPGIVAVRDSKNPEGPTLVVEPAAWSAFTDNVKSPHGKSGLHVRPDPRPLVQERPKRVRELRGSGP